MSPDPPIPQAAAHGGAGGDRVAGELGLIDIHCHVLPGIDDGPETLDQAVALCRMLARDGVATAVATPHQLGRYDLLNSPDRIRHAVALLQARLDELHVPLKLHIGAEVRLDERIPRLLSEGHVLTLGNAGRYLLLELPPGVAFDAEAVRACVCRDRLRVVLAHAERYEFLRSPAVAAGWRQAGFLLQINGSSLVGGWGAAAQQAAWAMLDAGLVDVVASDAHSIGQRRPRWSEAVTQIAATLGDAEVRRLCMATPARILAGEPVE